MLRVQMLDLQQRVKAIHWKNDWRAVPEEALYPGAMKWEKLLKMISVEAYYLPGNF